MKFRTELWRIIKFILITGAVNVAFSLLNSSFIRSGFASGLSSYGTVLSISGWVFTLLTTAIATLLNRYFTFRATEKWYIAVPVMVIAAFCWNWLSALPRAASANLGMDAVLNMTTILGAAWFAVSYLLQRCVIYSHTIDTNGWYCRFHPTNEEGVYPNE